MTNPNDFDEAALFERLPIPLYATGRDGEVLAANAAFRTLLGLGDDLSQPSAREFYDRGGDRDEVIHALDESDLEFLDWEQTIRLPSGLHWIRPMTRVIRDENGKVERLEGGFLSQRRTGDADLSERLQAILEETNDPTAVIGPGGEMLWANRAARRILGIVQAELRDHPLVEDLVELPVPVERILANAPSRGDMAVKVRGRSYHFWINLELHSDADGNPAFYSFIARDLEPLDHATSRLAAAMMAQDQLLSTVAHEIRTPLTSVLGLASVLAEQLADSDTETAEIAQLIVDQATDLERIVGDLVRSAGSRSFRLFPEELDLAKVVEDAVGSSGVAPDSVTITGSGSGYGDAARIRQILRNLLTNATHYGQPPIWIQISVNERANISVIDHGPGVPASLSEALYEPYVTQGRRRGDTALGLGLTIASNLASEMGGTLSHRRVDEATVFTLSLPTTPNG